LKPIKYPEKNNRSRVARKYSKYSALYRTKTKPFRVAEIERKSDMFNTTNLNGSGVQKDFLKSRPRHSNEINSILEHLPQLEIRNEKKSIYLNKLSFTSIKSIDPLIQIENMHTLPSGLENIKIS